MKTVLFKFVTALLAFCMLALSAPAYAEEAVTAALPANILEAGQSATLELYNSKGEAITDLSGYTFTSSDTEIAGVDADGNVTGVAIGKAVITVSGEGVGKVEIPVVGANLLEQPSDDNISWTSSEDTSNSWWLRKALLAKVNDYMSDDGRYEMEVETRPDQFSDADNVLRLTSESLPESGITNQYMHLISVDYNSIPINKIYEFSGWASAENIPEDSDALHNGWKASLYYYTEENNKYTLRKVPNEATAVTPFDGKSGNQDWTYFSTAPVINDGLPDKYGLALRVALSGGKAVADGGWQGDILFSNLSLHEVKYDKLEFLTANSASAVTLQKGNTVDTTVKHYSNTGREITYRLTDANKVEENIQVNYSSSDEEVATVSQDGVICAAGTGCAHVTACATIGGVTKSEDICVTVNEEAPATDIFGSRYAYIRQTTDGDYILTVLAGIDSLNYKEVGFELISGGISCPEMSTTKVYKGVNVSYNDGTRDVVENVYPGDFGVTEDGYIFFRRETISAELAAKGIAMRAYAVDLDGNKIYGNYATISKIAE